MSEIKEVKPIETYQKKELPKIDWGEEVIEDFTEKFRIRKDVVRRVLEWDAATNNDFLMFIEALRDEFNVQVTSGKDNFHIVIPRKIVMKIPSPEVYTRARRKLNQEGIGLPTNPHVLEARKKKEKSMREYFKKLKRE